MDIVVTEPAQKICAENVSLTEKDHEQGLLATIVTTTCFCNHCSHYSAVRLLGKVVTVKRLQTVLLL